VSQDPFVLGAMDAFVFAAIPEELCKFLVLALYVRRHSAFDEPMDGLVYGATASLGFAALENVLYVATGGIGLAVVRALTAVPCHAALGALLGYGVARSRFEGRALILALPLPIFLHGLYDFPLLTLRAGGDALGDGVIALLLVLAIAVLVITLIAAARLARRLRGEQALVGRAG
ncbi:MAG: PrsW family intramembrane metalloprotease, partial [Myxococcales bacterium]|nr:PrsW family intramembrane metalloprotease [Myxococcales bacterium]